MAYNLGKKFEDKVKRDWALSLPGRTLIRLADQQSRYKGQSSNVSDYIGHAFNKMWLIECKETKENTFNFAKLTQYDRLLEHKDEENTLPGVLLWFSKHNVIIWVNIGVIEQMKLDGKKSINIKDVENQTYKLYVIPTKKLITFLRCDFTYFENIEK